MSDDPESMSEEEERRFDLAAVSIYFFAAAVALYLLSFLACAVAIFTFMGGAHPTSDSAGAQLRWGIIYLGAAICLAIIASYLWRGGLTRLKGLQRPRPGFPVEPSATRVHDPPRTHAP